MHGCRVGITPCSKSRVHLGWGWPAQPILVIFSAGLLENVEREDAAARPIGLREQYFLQPKEPAQVDLMGCSCLGITA